MLLGRGTDGGTCCRMKSRILWCGRKGNVNKHLRVVFVALGGSADGYGERKIVTLLRRLSHHYVDARNGHFAGVCGGLDDSLGWRIERQLGLVRRGSGLTAACAI